MATEPIITLFGGVACTVDGRDAPLPSGKPAVLLAVLAVEADRAVSVTAIVDALWEDDPPSSARPLVHTYMSALRRALAEVGGPSISTVRQGYRLHCAPSEVDLLRFFAATSGDDVDAWRWALHASSLPLLGAEGHAFLEPLRARAAAARRATQDRLWARLIDEGRAGETVPALREAVAEDPLDEERAVLLALALAGLGRGADGAAVLDAFRQRLGVELGMDPSPRVAAARQRVLANAAEGESAGRPEDIATVPPAEESLRPGRRHRRRALTWGLAAAAVVIAAGAAVWTAGPGRTGTATAPITERGLLVLDSSTGEITDSRTLSSSPAQLETSAGRIWVRSEADRTVAFVDLDTPEAGRAAGLPVAPTSLAAQGDVAYVALGFTGEVATVADGRVEPPRAAAEDAEGRVTLAADDSGLWVATIGGVVHAPSGAGWNEPASVEGLPVRLAVDGGEAWVLTRSPDTLVRLDGSLAPAASELRGTPVDLAVADGIAWAVTEGDDRLWGTSADGDRVVATVVLPGTPVAVAASADRVWVATARPAAVLAFDRTTLERRSLTALPGEPADLVLEDQRIIVALR
ncbi:BTAD domain-containing putative transcriptional regulator [Microbacterium sp. NPDC019599]|uniref:BTAD domain-containing putative transcriptional regulator n=1 Tax=Microbacterium sp. NPDC019599 TaxID=3154690 RepID=UPI0033DD5054